MKIESFAAILNHSQQSDQVYRALLTAGLQPAQVHKQSGDQISLATIESLATEDAVFLSAGSLVNDSSQRPHSALVICLHAAPLPHYRGEDATAWTLYHDDPLAVSAYIAGEAPQSGLILRTKPIRVERGDTWERITEKVCDGLAVLAVEVLSSAMKGELVGLSQHDWEGRTFTRPMPVDLRAELDRRLGAGEYTHYV